MREGTIIKGVGGLYTVACAGERFPCRARGLFRLKKITPMVGDRVAFEPAADGKEGRIDDILPRSSALKRPAVANVDLNVIVIAAKEPQPDLLLVDRLLAQAVESGIEAILCVNKSDQVDAAGLEALTRQYRHLPAVCAVTREDPSTVEALRSRMRGHTSCFSGQSGVGKSTLINALTGEAEDMEVGEISDRTRRGRHTTRHVELRALEGGGFVADTPGFSLLEMDLMDPEKLAEFYPDFLPYREECRFIGCVHDKEPDCRVKEAAEAGQIDAERYARYRQLLAELKERWKNRYD